jgi:hypothetical protein
LDPYRSAFLSGSQVWKIVLKKFHQTGMDLSIAFLVEVKAINEILAVHLGRSCSLQLFPNIEDTAAVGLAHSLHLFSIGSGNFIGTILLV